MHHSACTPAPPLTAPPLPCSGAVFFLKSATPPLRGATASACDSAAQCCLDNKLWAYKVARGAITQERGSIEQPVGSTPVRQDWRVLTLDGQVRQGSYVNNLEWDNVWWERGAVLREPAGGGVLVMPHNATQTYIDWPTKNHWAIGPSNNNLANWTLLAPADLSRSSTTPGRGGPLP